ncbi:MAG TPA: FKBP-type peptidyl-prolyl cis-trans isomerase [Bacteroidia bacterium]|nr:FKBP-type peptidyl-prolyl cis-trans isomerase [Bacteroidia bacterium]
MFNKSLLLLFFLISSAAFAQQKSAFQKTASGLEYRIYRNGGKTKPVAGDLIKTILVYTNHKDSVIYDSRISRPENVFELLAPTFKGSLEEGMLMMAIGDSAIFKVNADSIYAKTFKTPRPKYVKKGSKLTFRIKLLGIKTKESIDTRTPEEIEKDNEARRIAEPNLIKEFVELNAITAQPSESGLYYIERQAGSGPSITKTSKVKIVYNCTTLDGTMIDSQQKPIEIDMSLGKITKGMEEGLLKMSMGAKATLIIPSALAFGKRKISTVQPYTTLIYDMEVIEVNE